MPSEFIPLQSTNLRGFEYDPTTMQLIVEFTDGDRYLHYNVSQDVVSGLQTAESPGRYYREILRNRFNVSKI